MDKSNYPHPKICIAVSAHFPSPPTSSLPPLARLPTTPIEQISSALTRLRLLYWPPPPPPLPKSIVIPKRNLPKYLTKGSTSVPDSGYASADDEEDEGKESEPVEAWEQPEWDGHSETALDILRADPFERAFAIKWVTGFVARHDAWVDSQHEDDVGGDCGNEEQYASLLEEASTILSAFAAGDDEEFSVTRTFNFLPSSKDKEVEEARFLSVELNDAPVPNDDHTSVGLQSWGSSILLAEKMAVSPSTFSLHLSPDYHDKPQRILELGAGTGLVSIVTAKLLAATEPEPEPE